MQNGSKDPPKKTTSMKARLLTTLATLLLALTSWAYGVEIDGIYYVLDSSTNTAIVVYTGSTNTNPNTPYKGNIAIPASVTYGGTAYRVTKIGNYAFYGCSGLTSVSIPSSVTTIGDGAFKECLKNVQNHRQNRGINTKMGLTENGRPLNS